MWLEVGPSNNNPSIVAQYFVECVRQVGGTPRIIRGDCGTENVNTAAIQRFLRANSDDSFAGEKSFMYGSLCQIRELRRGGGFSENPVLVGGSITLKTCETVVYMTTVTIFMLSVWSFVTILYWKQSFIRRQGCGIFARSVHHLMKSHLPIGQMSSITFQSSQEHGTTALKLTMMICRLQKACAVLCRRTPVVILVLRNWQALLWQKKNFTCQPPTKKQGNCTYESWQVFRRPLH